jgi:hypothetical protein
MSIRQHREALIAAFAKALDSCITSHEDGPYKDKEPVLFDAQILFEFEPTGQIRSRPALNMRADLWQQINVEPHVARAVQELEESTQSVLDAAGVRLGTR